MVTFSQSGFVFRSSLRSIPADMCGSVFVMSVKGDVVLLQQLGDLRDRVSVQVCVFVVKVL